MTDRVSQMYRLQEEVLNYSTIITYNSHYEFLKACESVKNILISSDSIVSPFTLTIKQPICTDSSYTINSITFIMCGLHSKTLW